jgi:HPt (histidine-containing phosphotransfer) domain-containing protein
MKNNSSHLQVTGEYDLTMLRRISRGDQEFIRKVLRVFIETMPALLLQLDLACKQEDWETISRIAHQMKASIDTFGIVRARQAVRVIESNASTRNNLCVVPENFKQLRDVVSICVNEFKHELAIA